MGHHYVPQSHLRKFEDPNHTGAIWQHHKHGNQPKLIPIKNVAQAKGFYSQETEARLANEVESPGDKVIQKLILAEAISPVERLQLTYYLATMIKRVPTRRRQALEMAPGLIPGVIAQCREKVLSLADEVRLNPDLVSKRIEEIEAVGKKFEQKLPDNIFEHVNEPWPTEQMLQAIYDMTWRIATASGPQFFATSDNPVFFFSCYGVGSDESELCFPLSPVHALHGCNQGRRADILRIQVRQKFVREINRRMASDVERFAFYLSPATWLRTILPKQSPYLSRMMW